MMEGEVNLTVNISDADWDALIVLDALRYDYFLKSHNFFFEGYLNRIWSPGSCTVEWFRKTFTEKMPDITYFSANPFINSSKRGKCGAGAIFREVIDIWLLYWDDNLGTVQPLAVNHVVRDRFPRSGGTIIVHYLQPHSPYLSPRGFVYGFPHPKSGKVLHGVNRARNLYERIGSKFVGLVGTLFDRVGIPNGHYLKMAELLNLPPLSPLDATRRRFGISGLKLAYEDNVMLVLDIASRLIEHLMDSGLKIVVTSDHGEFLGEGGRFSHPCGSNHEILRTVPVFTVKSVKKGRPDLSKMIHKVKMLAIKEKIMK